MYPASHLMLMHRRVRRKGKLTAVESTLVRSRSQLHSPLCRLDLIPARGTVSESVHFLLGHKSNERHYHEQCQG